MKTYSLTDPLPDRLPMTPPDEPPEPDMDAVDDCVKCGQRPSLAFMCDSPYAGTGSYRWFVHCFRCDRTGPMARNTDGATDGWNQWQKE